MAEERLLRFLKLKLTDEQADKISPAERQFLLDKGFDDVDAWALATLDQLEEPPGDRGGLRPGRANMLLKAFNTGADMQSMACVHACSQSRCSRGKLLSPRASLERPPLLINLSYALTTCALVASYPSLTNSFACPCLCSDGSWSGRRLR